MNSASAARPKPGTRCLHTTVGCISLKNKTINQVARSLVEKLDIQRSPGVRAKVAAGVSSLKNKLTR